MIRICQLGEEGQLNKQWREQLEGQLKVIHYSKALINEKVISDIIFVYSMLKNERIVIKLRYFLGIP